MTFKALTYGKRIPLLLICLVFICGCTSNKTENNPDENIVEALAPEPTYIEYTVTGMKFEGPTTIPSGWTTIRLNNLSAMTHFALVERIPDSITVADQQRLVAPVFQNFMDNFNGKPLSEPDAGMELPEWFGGIEYLGGPGLVAPQYAGETTVFLAPGNYMIECYVKTDGIFHSYNPDPDQTGMVLGLTVSAEKNGLAEPTPTMELSVSSSEGITVNGSATEGLNIVKVTFTDQAVYENFVGHDVHLVKLDGDADQAAVAAWMNWTTPEGLQTPAPATFVGGINDMAAGGVGYIHVNLEPGTYAWVAEIPDPASRGMFQIFTIGDAM